MSLVRLLNQQQQRMDTLITLMSKEQTLLTQGTIDGDALAALAKEKQALLEELDRMEHLRRNVQKRLG